ncbi:MAG: GNAT family N-acetyltransferase [Hyphomicrobiales bacterium]|nr:GNAT family N-acetyltransferase [Hyphomicrobiales bacterium]MBV9520172.1 GNAT family N-acetyltransferase [Hyphomicrobiales bacterium]
MTLRIEPATGAALQRALPALAKLRIEVFREWPYLYEGSLDYEANYIERFARLKDGVIVVATDAGEAVGAATAAPLEGQNPDVTAPFVEVGYELGKLFYFGESVLKRAYRGRGIGHAFFDQREAVALSSSGVEFATFSGVLRAPDDPRRDQNYRPLDDFWRKRGYAPVEGLVGNYSWTDIGDKEQTRKPMQFWMRKL